MFYMRKATSLTISSDILAEIATTKGAGSTSDRVNNLLKRALELEKRERLEQEAAEFFGNNAANSDTERAAFQKASKNAISRD
jgi:diphthamide biosynthesis methyltransferase